MAMGKWTSTRKRKRKKKRQARTNSQNRQNAIVLPSNYTDNSLLKNSTKVKMRYVERVPINPSAGGVGVYVFSATGLYDPNTTGGGQ